MGSHAMIYIPSFIKIGSGIQQGDLISLLLFFQNEGSRLIKEERRPNGRVFI
jgi:hypothetical protein